MDRQTRKDLKTDKFALEVSHGFDWLTEHKKESIRYGAIALAVILAAAGIYFYMHHQAGVREEALAQALRIDDATVGPTVQPTNLHFDTQDELNKARTKAYTDLAAKYHGTQEGAIAGIYLASDLADKGNLDQAEKQFKDVADSAPKAYAALASLSLAQVYAAEGRISDSEKVLRALIASPTVTVSKEEASIVLGQILSKSNPAEAHKLIDPLRTSPRGAVSQAAITASANIPQTASQ